MLNHKTLCVITLFVSQFLSALIGSEVDENKPFVHPGLLHSQAEIEFVKEKLSAGEEPWASAWNELRSSDSASLDYSPNPIPNVVRGTRNNPNVGSSNMSNDAAAAYTHALQWCLTGEPAYANKSIEILNAWSSTLQSVGGHDQKLLIGMAGVSFCNAAELIRHTSHRWMSDDQNRFERMLREVFYPGIEGFYQTANGNWDAAMIQTMIAMGVFLDDHEMFDRATNYYLRGQGNGAIENYVNEFGECQESGRDQSHTQMGLGFLACGCEMAWKQGIDLYGAAGNRLAKGFEYTAGYNLGKNVPYEPYRSVDGRYHYRTISDKRRGRFAPIYERIVYHYHDRMGLEMPHCKQVVDGNRPERFSTTYISWGSLMFCGLPTGTQEGKSKEAKGAVKEKGGDHYDIYLLAGQSNMDGRGKSKKLTPAQRKPIDGATIFYRNALISSKQWMPLAPGFSMAPKYRGGLPSATFGPELGFARAMLDVEPDLKLALIKGSKGGTNLRKNWKPGTHGQPETQGEQYRDFVETIRLATKAMDDRGDSYTIRGLLWHQGESDGKSGENKYRTRFMEFAKRIRQDTGIEGLPIVVGEVFDNGKRDPVRAALQSIGNSGPGFGLVTSEGTKTWDPGTHFDAPSQLLLGRRYAEIMRKVQETQMMPAEK